MRRSDPAREWSESRCPTSTGGACRERWAFPRTQARGTPAPGLRRAQIGWGPRPCVLGLLLSRCPWGRLSGSALEGLRCPSPASDAVLYCPPAPARPRRQARTAPPPALQTHSVLSLQGRSQLFRLRHSVRVTVNCAQFE